MCHYLGVIEISQKETLENELFMMSIKPIPPHVYIVDHSDYARPMSVSQASAAVSGAPPVMVLTVSRRSGHSLSCSKETGCSLRTWGRTLWWQPPTSTACPNHTATTWCRKMTGECSITYLIYWCLTHLSTGGQQQTVYKSWCAPGHHWICQISMFYDPK